MIIKINTYNTRRYPLWAMRILQHMLLYYRPYISLLYHSHIYSYNKYTSPLLSN
jgi:hypothetical protein